MNETTDPHPVTEQAAAERWNKDARLIPWDDWWPVGRAAILSAFRDMHDAGREHERANPTDARPWEPLNGHPVRVGDEVRQDHGGITRIAVVGRVDDEGEPWTTESDFIGFLGIGTWYVRRASPELPTEDGAVIVPAEGHEFITMTGAVGWSFDRLTYSAKHDRWYGMTTRGSIAMCLAEQVTPDTWKVDDQ